MKRFKLNIQWNDGKTDTFVRVTSYDSKDGALHIWFSTGLPLPHIIPHSAYTMAWPEENEE